MEIRRILIRISCLKQVISVCSASMILKIRNSLVKKTPIILSVEILTWMSCFVSLLVLGGWAKHLMGAPSSVEHAIGEASEISQARVIKMLHTLADTFWKTHGYFKVPWDKNAAKKKKKSGKRKRVGWGGIKARQRVLAPSSSDAWRPKCLADNVYIRQSENNGL